MPLGKALGTLPVLIAIAACGGGGTTQLDELVVALFAGADQTAIGNTTVATAPAVRVLRNGLPKSGTAVTFTIEAGGGQLTGAQATTDGDGVARVGAWQLGAAGVAQRLRAVVSNAEGSPIFWDATAITGPFDQVYTEGAVNLGTAVVGQATTTKPIVRAVDVGGNPIAGVPLTWSVTGGGGSLVAPMGVTGADGRASIGSWLLGQVAGAQEMQVLPNVATPPQHPIVYTAVALPGPVTTIEKIAGDGQDAPAGTAVAVAPRVRLLDVFGNLVDNRTVTFAVTMGGGQATGTTPLSAIDGTAAVGGWVLGAVAGENRMSATADQVSITFTATGLGAFDPAPFAGTYAGTWTNTTFGSVGTGTAVITVNTGNNTATVTASATGNVLGGGPAAPPLQNGAYDGNGAQFNGSVPPMGTINATIVPPGTITATGTNVPNASIVSWTANGTITASAINLNFTVNFTAGAPAVGTINLVRQ